MNRTHNKSKSWGTISITMVALAIIVASIILTHQTYQDKEVSSLYSKYKDIEGVETSFIKDFKLNDSVSIDVTILEATTDTAWGMIKRDFNIKPTPEEVIEIIGNDNYYIKLSPKVNYALPADSIILNNDQLAISNKEHTITIYSLTSTKQLYPLDLYTFNEGIQKNI